MKNKWKKQLQGEQARIRYYKKFVQLQRHRVYSTQSLKSAKARKNKLLPTYYCRQRMYNALAMISDSLHPLARFCKILIVTVLNILVVSIPLFFLVKNEEIFEFNKMLLTYAGAAIILTSWLIYSIVQKKLYLRKTPFDWAILLFLISQGVSTILSIHPRTSLFGYYTRFHGGLFSILTYIILFYSATTFLNKKNRTGFIISILIGASLSTAYAFPEHFGYSPSCVLLDHQLNASCWIQDVQNRVFGTFGQPNWLAAYLVLLLPLCVGISMYPEKILSKHVLFGRTWMILLSGMMFATLLFTRSRSGFLGFGASVIVFSVLIVIHLLQKKEKVKIIVTPLAILLSWIAIAGYFGTPFSPTLAQIFHPAQSAELQAKTEAVTDRLETGGTDSGEIRKIVWKGAINVWKRYPVFGSGVETFAYSYYRDRPMEHNMVSEWDFLYNKAHNELLNFLATTGIVGLGSYLIFILLVLFYLFKKALVSQKDDAFLAASILSGLVALHISNFFGFSTVMVSILMYLLPVIVFTEPEIPLRTLPRFTALLSRFSSTPPKQESTTQLLSPLGWFGTGASLMVGVFLLFQIFAIWLADHNYAEAKRSLNSGDVVSAFDHIKASIQLSQYEGLYYEMYSKIAVQIALQAVAEEKMDIANTYGQATLTASNNSIILNPVHLNFYKTRTQILIMLAQAQPELYDSAIDTLKAAQELAPTDPKITYFTSLVLQAQHKDEEAKTTLRKAIEMKPNYEAALYSLGQLEQASGQFDQAKQHYQYILDTIAPGSQQAKDRLGEIATLEGKNKKVRNRE